MEFATIAFVSLTVETWSVSLDSALIILVMYLALQGPKALPLTTIVFVRKIPFVCQATVSTTPVSLLVCKHRLMETMMMDASVLLGVSVNLIIVLINNAQIYSLNGGVG